MNLRDTVLQDCGGTRWLERGNHVHIYKDYDSGDVFLRRNARRLFTLEQIIQGESITLEIEVSSGEGYFLDVYVKREGIVYVLSISYEQGERYMGLEVQKS